MTLGANAGVVLSAMLLVLLLVLMVLVLVLMLLMLLLVLTARCGILMRAALKRVLKPSSLTILFARWRRRWRWWRNLRRRW